LPISGYCLTDFTDGVTFPVPLGTYDSVILDPRVRGSRLQHCKEEAPTSSVTVANQGRKMRNDFVGDSDCVAPESGRIKAGRAMEALGLR
jgi:hypothetical protein